MMTILQGAEIGNVIALLVIKYLSKQITQRWMIRRKPVKTWTLLLGNVSINSLVQSKCMNMTIYYLIRLSTRHELVLDSNAAKFSSKAIVTIQNIIHSCEKKNLQTSLQVRRGNVPYVGGHKSHDHKHYKYAYRKKQ